MHAIKVGWIGQTFALAKGSESGGRKARIRRSKEERKEMVESFIKKYQSLNNGSFPSLNVTHKEVGGSFYTIREIVREIIQENRVLGPAKYLPEEQNTDLLLEQYPLGTISTELEISLSATGNPMVADQYQNASEEHGLIAEELDAEPEQQGFGNGKIGIGSDAITKEGECVKPKFVDVQVSEALKTEEIVEDVASYRAKVPQVADIMIEKIIPDQYQNTSEEHDSDIVGTEPEHHGLGNGQIIIASHAVTEDEKSNKPKAMEVQENETQEIEKTVEKIASSMAKIPEEANLMVETIPSQPNTEQINVLETEPEQQLIANEQVVNGIQVNVETEESKKAKVAEAQVSEPMEAEKRVNVVAASNGKSSEIADVIVETFPLRPVGKLTDYVPGNYGKGSDLNGAIQEEDVEKVLLDHGNGNTLLHGISSSKNSYLVDSKEVENTAGSLLESNSGLLNEKEAENLSVSSLQSSNASTTKDGFVNNTQMEVDVKLKLSHNYKALFEAKETTSTVIQTKSLDGTNGSTNNTNSITKEVVGIKKKPDVQHGGIHRKGSDTTLDRINIESWEKKSKNHAEPENPLWAVFKSFISALVKFWSE